MSKTFLSVAERLDRQVSVYALAAGLVVDEAWHMIPSVPPRADLGPACHVAATTACDARVLARLTGDGS